ncbi:MAG: glutamate--cysteine ligase [Pseudomonadota bacterium]|nr:glutamate--cysteine ligase [Pseudomonadota bacterium]
MSANLARALEKIERSGATTALRKIHRGIEKESLRVGQDGLISQRPHPPGLGSALTHPSITTDYSEALLEFITPVEQSVSRVLHDLEQVHRFTYQHLLRERLWVASMPCIVQGDSSIPIAEYGSSNIARMKHIYRVGLGSRYGRLMQVIAGIHYNFSLTNDFWIAWQALEGDAQPAITYQSQSYLAVVRNFYRHTWLVAYLFGASPAVCRSFVEGRTHQLERFGDSSYYLPHATSLRLSDLGYRSEAQERVVFNLDNLENYVEALRGATETSYPPYIKMGVKVGQQYRQLNHNVLQIENEYYAPVRPKRVTRPGEKPSHALRDRGIEYIEVRCLDLDPFTAIGIDEPTVRFLDLLLLYCLFEDSPDLTRQEMHQINRDLQQVILYGRRPGLEPPTGSTAQTLIEHGLALLDELVGLAELMDGSESTAYVDALRLQTKKFEDPTLTPSARSLHMMQEYDGSFFEFAMAQSIEHEQFFREHPLSVATSHQFDVIAQESIDHQRMIESSDKIDFDKFLKQYFAQ